MTFWCEVLAIFVADLGASLLILFFYVMIQWFLRATDVTVGYNWRWEGANFHPSFDIRNRSASRTYLLANIVYSKNDGKNIVFIDNKSLWDQVLSPGSVRKLEVAPVPGITILGECIETEVMVRLQTGRTFWLKGQGPGQLRAGRNQKIAFWLRQRFENAAFPLE